jgi:hypothetical protein
MKKQQVDHILRAAGRYADPVDEHSALLPKKWKSRLVALPPGDRELACRRIVGRARLLSLLEQTPIDGAVRDRIRADIECDFQTGPHRTG